jgi:Flp pilus assembly pilin Flp
MWMPRTLRNLTATKDASPPERPEGQATTLPRRRKRRRAATTMEYAAMISLILLVVIAGIQSFGISVGKLFTGDAAATTKASATTTGS